MDYEKDMYDPDASVGKEVGKAGLKIAGILLLTVVAFCLFLVAVIIALLLS